MQPLGAPPPLGLPASEGARPAAPKTAPIIEKRRMTPRKDPAPSRGIYRLERLRLSPRYQFWMRRGLPVLSVTVLCLGLALHPAVQGWALGQYQSLLTQFRNRPQAMVNMVTVIGATPELADAVQSELGLSLPVSSFEIDLTVMQEKVAAFDAVARADIAVRPGGVLQVSITERVPVVIQRIGPSDAQGRGLVLLDATGHRVASLIARSDRPDLPLIAGQDAQIAVPEALAIIQAAQPLAARLRGLIRIGARRWDLVLDRDQRIMLPAKEPIAALERFIALDQAHDLLGRAISHVDLRLENMPTVRLAQQEPENPVETQ